MRKSLVVLFMALVLIGLSVTYAVAADNENTEPVKSAVMAVPEAVQAGTDAVAPAVPGAVKVVADTTAPIVPPAADAINATAAPVAQGVSDAAQAVVAPLAPGDEKK